MTKEQRATLSNLKQILQGANRSLTEAQNRMAEAVLVSHGTALSSQLASVYDDIGDLRCYVKEKLQEHENRLKGKGNEAPESWREAL